MIPIQKNIIDIYVFYLGTEIHGSLYSHVRVPQYYTFYTNFVDDIE